MLSKIPFLNNESGFVLALSIMLLAVCTIIGLAATMNSTNEVEITTSDTVYREVLYGTEAGASIAMETLLANQDMSAWTDGEFLDAAEQVQVMDGTFLTEGQDSDSRRVWNYWERYQFCDVGTAKPLDDLNIPDGAPNSSTPYVTDTDPDIRVRIPGQFVVDIDVDKVKSKHIAGSGAEFGSGAEGLFGTKITYNFNCIGTLPGRDRTDRSSPKAEVMVGYRYVPAGM